MLSLTQHYYASMQAYLDDLNQVIPVLEMPSLQEAFPQTLNQLSVGIHGFGAIGGGYLAKFYRTGMAIPVLNVFMLLHGIPYIVLQ